MGEFYYQGYKWITENLGKRRERGKRQQVCPEITEESIPEKKGRILERGVC